jgi:CheY-like chemotaxis protein
MVVHDEIDITYTISKMREIDGANVERFNDPKVALKNYKPHIYDFALLDIRMPNWMS